MMHYFADIGSDGVVKSATKHIGPASNSHGMAEISEEDFEAIKSGMVVRRVSPGRFVHEHRPFSHVELRHAAYPPIGDQLDAFWKGGAEAEAMRARVMAVKEKHPKPSP